MRGTTVTLARIEMPKESMEQLLASVSNRVDVIEVPESPSRHPMFEEKAVWWDLDEHHGYQYFEIDQLKEGSGTGKLQAYLVDTSGTHVLYLCSRKR